MALFIDNSIRFITKNLDDILLVALGLFIFVIIKYQFDPNPNPQDKNNETKKVKQEIIIEALTQKEKINNILNDTTADFCETLKGESHSIEKRCKMQRPNVCKTLDCCVLAMKKGERRGKCLAGSKVGPTYHTDKNGNDLNFDYYYYQNKCYGPGCPKR